MVKIFFFHVIAKRLTKLLHSSWFEANFFDFSLVRAKIVSDLAAPASRFISVNYNKQYSPAFLGLGSLFGGGSDESKKDDASVKKEDSSSGNDEEIRGKEGYGAGEEN